MFDVRRLTVLLLPILGSVLIANILWFGISGFIGHRPDWGLLAGATFGALLVAVGGYAVVLVANALWRRS